MGSRMAVSSHGSLSPQGAEVQTPHIVHPAAAWAHILRKAGGGPFQRVFRGRRQARRGTSLSWRLGWPLLVVRELQASQAGGAGLSSVLKLGHGGHTQRSQDPSPQPDLLQTEL